MALYRAPSTRIHPDAGLGVFVARAYRAREAVCVYAGDDVAITAEAAEDPYAMYHPDGTSFRVGTRTPVGADGYGQLINDAATIVLPCAVGDLDLPKWTAALDAYTAASTAGANVAFLTYGAPWTLYATRDLVAGEELFLHYGADYWATRAAAKCIHPLPCLIMQLDRADMVLRLGDGSFAETFMDALGLSVESRTVRTFCGGAVLPPLDALARVTAAVRYTHRT